MNGVEVTTNELTVLAIDDQEDNLITARALLNEAFPSARILTATNGPQGLELAATHELDVILLDIVMPGMDGYEVCRRLKADARTRDVPVVVLTALRSDRENRVKALEVGAEAFLSKPIEETELRAQVRAMAQIRAAIRSKADESKRLVAQVAERTRTLEQSRNSAVQLLEELRESERRFRALFESSRDALMTLGPPDWKFASGNRACLDVFRAKNVAEFTALGPWDLSPPTQPDGRPSAEKAVAQIELALRTGSHFFEWMHRRLDGDEFPAEVLLTRLELSGQACIQATVRDIGARKRLEEQLVLSDRLASMGTLAAGMAHEINNPLSFVVGNLDYVVDALKQTDGAPVAPSRTEILDALLEAQEGADRVRRIVRDLKTFSRPDDAELTNVNVEALLDSSIGLVQNELRHRAQLVRDYACVAPVVANESRLGQVFLNLLLNAVQAIPEGRTDRHRVWVTTRTDETGSVVVAISDTGGGIPPALLGRIFDPFFTTKPVGEGTGLGLAICHGIVTALGGRIGVESTSGQGATFTVVLPRGVPASKAASEAPHSLAPPKRARVLLIDDEDKVSRAICRTLAGSHDVESHACASDALARIGSGATFDVVVCDLMMPVMSGMDLHEALLRTNPALADRVLFITGGAFTPKARQFLDRVPNVRLEKPLDARFLIQAIGRLLEAP